MAKRTSTSIPPPAADAFGRGLLAFLDGGPSLEIIERDDGLIEAHDGVSAYFAEHARWMGMERRAIGLARGRVLDIGAGAGRVALHLQRLGLAVTAIDNSPLAIEACRRRGVKRAILRPIEAMDRFGDGAFDTIVMFANNWGLWGGRAKARRLLATMHRISSDGAVILAGSLDPHATDDPVHLSYHGRNRGRGRMPGQVRIRVRYRDCVGPWFDYLFVSPDEMRSLLAGTGWRVRRIIEGKGALYIAVLVKE